MKRKLMINKKAVVLLRAYRLILRVQSYFKKPDYFSPSRTKELEAEVDREIKLLIPMIKKREYQEPVKGRKWPSPEAQLRIR